MSDPDYCYPPDFTVLRNKLGIRDAPTLEAAERRFIAQRLLEAVPTGDFDLDHLRAIHRAAARRYGRFAYLPNASGRHAASLILPIDMCTGMRYRAP